MKRWIALACGLVVGACALPTVAGASTRSSAISYGTSCIDGNANGVCGDSADTPLAQALDSNTMYLDSQHGSHSGLVLSGGVKLPTFIYVQVTKNIVISGSVKITGEDVGGTLETLRGNIFVASGTQFNVTDSLELHTVASTSTIDIGSGVAAHVAGETVDLMFRSAGSVHLASHSDFRIGGGGYATVYFVGSNGVTIDSYQSFRGPNHGAYQIDAGSDLNLTNVNWKAGYVLINAFGSDAHPGPRTITIESSTLNQIYRNGNMKIYADTDRDNPGLGKILIDHSTLIAKDPDGGIVNPMATCTNSVAPTWVCQ